MSNPKIWLIQRDHSKLIKALQSIKKDSCDNYLYTNCISQFNFSDVIMSSKNFNTFFYSHDTNTCIVFMKDSIKEVEFTKKYLNEEGINYHQISFKNEPEDIINRFPNTLHNYERYPKEMWVVNGEEDLIQLLEDSLSKQKKKITYYPLIDSNITLKYSNHCDEECEFNKFLFSGVIVTVDKILLIQKNKNNENIINYLIENTCNDLGLRYVTIHFNKPKFINTEDKRNRSYEADHVLSKILDK